MDIHSVRQMLRLKSIYEIPLRVTFYARVSSEKDEQLNSLDNQITYYTELIKKNHNWKYVDGYIDEGISGISVKKRENFHQMVNDAKEDKFDLIITKEITRFARNTLDSIKYTRELINYGVGVFFQNDNINTLDEDSELRLTIMSGIAQDELRKLSSRIKFGHQQAIKNKVVLGNSRIFGYAKDGKRLVIDEKEAPMVKELFELYSTGKYSMKKIEDIFWKKGYRNHNGNKISHTTMSNMISNPKYKGYYCGNKVKIIDMFTKKQKFLPPEEWVMFKDETGEIVPTIVDEQTWERANSVLTRRSNDVKNRQGICNHENLLTGKLFCTHCGKSYYRRESKDKKGNKNSIWICSGKLKNGFNSCPSFSIYESEIKPMLYDVFTNTTSGTDKLLKQYVEYYKVFDSNNVVCKNIEAIKKRIDTANQKKSKLLEYNIEGKLADNDFLKMNDKLNEDINKAEEEISNLQEQKKNKEKINRHFIEIKHLIEDAKLDVKDNVVDKSFVDKYIDKIYVTPHEGYMDIKVKIFTGETIEKNLENMRVHTGHFFKKMIEQYENSMK